jgi:cathepsin L
MLLLGLCIMGAAELEYDGREEVEFVHWMRKFNIMYPVEEFSLRFGIWLRAKRLVWEYKYGHKVGWRVGLNQFAALTTFEYHALLGTRPKIPETAARPLIREAVEPPPPFENLDWRDQGAVNRIKCQLDCGSCWAFAAVAASEGAYWMQTKTLLSFSESNLIDCVQTCFGCDGGMISDALEWVVRQQDGKFMREQDYPYRPCAGTCRFEKERSVGSISTFVRIMEENEEDLREQCHRLGPVAVTVDASQWTFQLYAGGIYEDRRCKSRDVNHGMTVVGYGREWHSEFWIVRNSWGESWGERGYMRLRRNFGNLCGIATMALAVVP